MAYFVMAVGLEDVQDLPDGLGCEYTGTCSKRMSIPWDMVVFRVLLPSIPSLPNVMHP